MTINPTDLLLLASVRMTDQPDGGGQMSSTTLQDGVENNVFPDISSTDRAFGRLQLRKVFPAVMSNDTDTLLGSHVIISDTTDDPDVVEFAMLSEGPGETRADAVARLEVEHWEALGPAVTWSSATRINSPTFAIVPGMVVFAAAVPSGYKPPVLIATAVDAGSGNYDVTYYGAAQTAGNAVLGVPSTTSPRLAVCRPITGALSAGATTCDIDSVLAQVVPKQIGAAAGNAAQIGIDAVPVVPEGVAAGIRSGDGLVVHHTAVVSAATYANGATVNCGRTNLTAVRIVDVDGLGISTGWTVNLATGVVSISSVAGWAQPVTVHHTIEEVLACARTGYSEVTGGSTAGASTQVAGPFALSSGLEMYAGRPNIGRIRVISKDGLDITDRTVWGGASYSRAFEVDLAAGTVTASVTFGASWNASFITSHSPVTLVSSGTYYAPSAPSTPQATLNRVTFNRALTRAFPSGSFLSSMLFIGDLQAQAGAAFSQETWTDVWADARIGDPIVAQFNDTAHPVIVRNDGAVNERWAIIFTSSTAFRLVGQTLGQIATGNVATGLAPINPASPTSQPYFTLAAAGWGSGWSTGNVLRFNTRGSNAGVWAARGVLPSAPNTTPDSLLIAIRGDINV